MNLELTNEEREFLLTVLRDRLGTLREQVHHATVSTFKDDLKAQEETFRTLIERLEAGEASE